MPVGYTPLQMGKTISSASQLVMKMSTETINLLISASVAALIIAFSFLMLKLVMAINETKPQPGKRGTQGRKRTPTQNKKLEVKLLAMLNDDRKGANRLLKGAKRMHPGKSVEWYWEKVIDDLERDRR